MSDEYERVMVDLRVPQDGHRLLRMYCMDEFGSIEGYLGQEAERAMREYADLDAAAKVEERLDDALEGAGLRPADGDEKKNILSEQGRPPLADQPKFRMTCRVPKECRDEFTAKAAEADDYPGVEMARAILSYIDGGRAARMDRKLKRYLDATGKETASDERSAKERKVDEATARLDTEFTDERLNEVVDDVFAQAGEASPPTRKKWRRRLITEEKNVRPHPHNTGLWVQPEAAREYADGDPPEVCLQAVEVLEDDEKALRVALEIGVQAMDGGGTATASLDAVREKPKYLDEEERTKKTKSVMDRVAEQYAGFKRDPFGGEERLTVDLRQTNTANGDPDLYSHIKAYHESLHGDADDAMADAPPDTDTDDGDTEPDDQDRDDVDGAADLDDAGAEARGEFDEDREDGEERAEDDRIAEADGEFNRLLSAQGD